MNKFAVFMGLLLLSACSAKQQNLPADYDYLEVDDGGETVDHVEEEGASKKSGELPLFEQRSQEINVQEGETVTMDCSVRKPTDHMLIFQKNEQLIFVGTMEVVKSTKIVNREQIFELPNADRTDSGDYSCIYQTKPDVKITYKVNVQYQPTVFTKTPKIQKVDKGSSVTVKCQAKGNPEPVIRWSKDNGRLPSGAESEEGISLTMEDVDRHVEGTYVCTADNGIGEPASTAMKIMVEYPPEITTEKAIVRTGEGDIVELVCIIHARPQASVTWTRNSEDLEPNPEIKEVDGGHRHALTISGVTEDKFGTYECTAENQMGKAVRAISLTDEPKQPHFTSPATSAAETMYTLAWETESYYPITEYTVKYRLAEANETTDLPGDWHEETIVVSEEDLEKDGLVHNMKYEIKNLVPATDYEAVVIVKNKLKQGEQASFNFSTRKEMVGLHTNTIGGSDLQRASIAVLVASVILSMFS